MHIPSTLRLMGHTVTVLQVSPIQWKHPDCLGFFKPDTMTIVVRRGRRSVMEQTFVHEMTHAILYCMNSPHYENEEFVDTFAGLAHQALTSARNKPRQPRRPRKKPSAKKG